MTLSFSGLFQKKKFYVVEKNEKMLVEINA